MGIKISKLGTNQIDIETEIPPSEFIIEVHPTKSKNIFNIKILHPNKTFLTKDFVDVLLDLKLYKRSLIKLIEGNKSIKGITEIPGDIRRKFKGKSMLLEEKTLDVIYDKNHKVNDFNEAFSFAKSKILPSLSFMDREVENIKHIPYYKKGKMQLKLKEK